MLLSFQLIYCFVFSSCSLATGVSIYILNFVRHFTQLSNHFIVVIAVCFYLSFCLCAGFGAVSEGSVSLGWYSSANCIIRRLNPGFVYLLIYLCMVTYVAFLFCTQACYVQNPELTHCLATKSVWCSGLSCGCLMRGSLFKPWKGWKNLGQCRRQFGTMVNGMAEQLEDPWFRSQ